MREQMREAAPRGDNHYSHFGPEANLFEELETTFADLCRNRRRADPHLCSRRARGRAAQRPPGKFTPWREFKSGSDLLFYEGLHGAVVTGEVDVAQHVDLKIGVVPVINLEWIQKLHRDKASRGYSTEAVTDTILRRMPDYINYHLPAVHRDRHQLPARADGRHVQSVHRALDPDARRIDGRHPLPRSARHRLPLSAVDDPRRFMSRANSIVIPGGKLDLAMQLILTPMILKLIERRRRA